MNEWIGNHEQKWKLLYKATRDGFESAQLHRCCDNSGPTITVVESNNGGYLLGGYTSVSWHSSGIFIEDHNNPFLFTLTNPCGIEPTKYSAVLEKYAIYAHRDYGPTFGGGHDLFVANSSDKNRHSSANFPHSYHDTTARGSMTFTGGNHFQPSEIEVYRLLNS